MKRKLEGNGSAANSIIAELLDALEYAQGELTSGWIEPMSIVLVLKTKIYPAIRNARQYLEQQNIVKASQHGSTNKKGKR